MYLVRSGAAAGLEQLVHELGSNPVDIIHSAGLSPSQFRDPDGYIAYDKLAGLLELCSRRCAAPMFGLQLAQRQSANVLGALPVIVSGSGTVGEALDAVGRYLYLHASGVHIAREVRGHVARLTLTLDFDSPHGIDQLMQMSVGHLANFMAVLLNSDRFGMTLHLRQAAPGELADSRKPLFRRIRFGERFDGTNIDARKIESPVHVDQSALSAHLRGYLEQLQNRYPDDLEHQVKDVIGRLLPVGECSIERVAATLNMHPRTLQSRLRNDQTSYREILQDTRQGLAEHHLRYGAGSITDLALQLGYAEVAVFSRHFKRWSGVSPREWQKRHRN